MSIRNYSDHAANERTFLAWVRTAIAIMAFGFLVEKFDLFLKFAAVSMGGRAHMAGQAFGGWAGLALILLGLTIVAVATLRFLRTARDIDSAKTYLAAGSQLDLALAVLLALLGASLFLYMLMNLLTPR